MLTLLTGGRGGALVAIFDKLVRGLPRHEIRAHLQSVLAEGEGEGKLAEQVTFRYLALLELQ